MPLRPGNWILPCPHCGAEAVVFDQISVTLDSIDRDGADRHWMVGACPGCGGAILAELGNGGAYFNAVYPRTTEEWEVAHLAPDVTVPWQEAITVHRAGANASCVVACGRTLEAAAANLGMEGKRLIDKIESMLTADLITSRFKEAMDYVRVIRNVGAHAGSPVSQETAEGTMRFTQQALRLLYEVPGELARLTGHPPELTGDPEGKD